MRDAFELRIAPIAARHRVLLLAVVSLACGVAYTASILGIRALNPRDVSWMRGDMIDEYLGWTFMRQDPITALPLTFTDRIGYPLTVSAAHFDILPVVAIALLPFSRFLPAEFQYFGALECGCAAALFYVGHELWRLHGRSEIAALASGVLVMTNAVFTARVAIHTALTAQFFILWVIYEFIRHFGVGAGDGRSSTAAVRRSKLMHLCFIGIVAVGFNPYIGLMVIALIGAYAIQLVITDPRSIRFVLACGGAGAALLALSSWFFGYFGRSETNAGPGYGMYSANLNAFVNPVVFSRFFPALPLVKLEQVEGSAYLGASFICMLVVAVVAATSSARFRRHFRPLLPLFFLTAASFCIALSNRVTLGNRTLFEVPLPAPILDVLSVFRTSGRLTWPLFYVAVAVSIVSVSLLVPQRFQGLCAVTLAFLQVGELAPLRDVARAAVTMNEGIPIELRSAAFRRLGEQHRHLVVLPAWQCGPERSPAAMNGYATFGLLAARQHMTINSYYSGRYSERAFRVHCHDVPAELKRRGPAPDTAYVVDSEFLEWFRAHAPSTHECGVRDGFNLCVRRGALY